MKLTYTTTRPRCGSGLAISACALAAVILALTGFPPVLNSWNNAKRGLDGPEPPS